MANTRRMNRLEELGRVNAEKAYTRKGKKNLKAEKSRIVGELKRKKGGSAKFPDLSGDGKVTKKDILMGRGVIKKKRGGAVDSPKKKKKKKGLLGIAVEMFRPKTISAKDGGAINKKLLDELRKRKPAGRLNVDDLKQLLKQKRRTKKPKKDINRYDEYMRSKKSPPKTMKARGGGIAKRGMGRAK